jgi:hypothetical protein
MAVKKPARARGKARKTSKMAPPAPQEAAPVEAPIELAVPADEPASEPQPRMKFTRKAAVVVGLLAIAVIAGAAMFSGRDSGQRMEAAAVAAPVQPETASAPPAPAKPVRAVPGKKAPPRVRPADAPPAPKTAAELPDAATLDGCLEQSGQTFRLKNTSGDDAPKSRSWKSGFLKKTARPVDVVDWNNRLKDHVGERISVSGMFVDGEMHVRTLRRVSLSCN